MNRTHVATIAVLALGCQAALIAQLAGLASFTVLGASVAVGGVVVCSSVIMAHGSHARKPGFRGGNTGKVTSRVKMLATPPDIDPASIWSHQTFSK